ncbi:hypothetical protein EON79_21030 [bacterium]|nr:MAG: hypothetical protein EON79_21030 [bacterium]
MGSFPMRQRELKGHMDWEIGRSVAFAESSIHSDYKKLSSTDPNAPNMDVVMAAAPQSAIDTILELVRKAGKKAAAIDVEPLAIARSLALSYDAEAANGSICVVDMGYSTTAINIYRNNELASPRQVPIGGEMLTRAVADALGISFEEAEARKESAVIPADAVATDAAAFGGGYGAFDPNPFSADTTSYGAPAYDPSGSVADANYGAQPYGATDPGAAGGYDPNATVSGASPYGASPFNDDLAIDPITGQPMSAPASTPPPAYGAAEPTGSFDPYGAPIDDAGAASFDPNLTVPGTPPAYDATPAPVPAPAADPAFEAMRPILEEFVAEIRRSIDYYTGRGGGVAQILLAGGGTKVGGLDGYVSRSLNVPCAPYNPLRGLQISARRVAPGFLEDHGQEFAIAVGNGLHILF